MVDTMGHYNKIIVDLIAELIKAKQGDAKTTNLTDAIKKIVNIEGVDVNVSNKNGPNAFDLLADQELYDDVYNILLGRGAEHSEHFNSLSEYIN